MIGNTDDWLRLVFSHEYTHIVHLEKSRGWIGGLRRVFGRAPVLYPNLFLPLWQIEGIATYEESALTGEGRVPAGDFRMIVDGRRPRVASRRSIAPTAVSWTGPAETPHISTAPTFTNSSRTGSAPTRSARLRDATAGRLPFTRLARISQGVRTFAGTLWSDFEADTCAGPVQRQARGPNGSG